MHLDHHWTRRMQRTIHGIESRHGFQCRCKNNLTFLESIQVSDSDTLQPSSSSSNIVTKNASRKFMFHVQILYHRCVIGIKIKAKHTNSEQSDYLSSWDGIRRGRPNFHQRGVRWGNYMKCCSLGPGWLLPGYHHHHHHHYHALIV